MENTVQLNKAQRLVANATAKDMSRPSLHSIHIRRGMVEAANGFILVQKPIEYKGESVLLDRDDILPLKDSRSLGVVQLIFNGESDVKAIGETTTIIQKIVATYPDTKQLYPKGRKKYMVALGRDQLLLLLKSLDKDENCVVFSFYGKSEEHRPVVFEVGDTAKGLIMPMSLPGKKVKPAKKMVVAS